MQGGHLSVSARPVIFGHSRCSVARLVEGEIWQDSNLGHGTPRRAEIFQRNPDIWAGIWSISVKSGTLEGNPADDITARHGAIIVKFVFN